MSRFSLCGFCKPPFVFAVGALTLALGLVAIGQPPAPFQEKAPSDAAVAGYDVSALSSEPSGGEYLDSPTSSQSQIVAAQAAPPVGAQFPWWDAEPAISASFQQPADKVLADTGSTVVVDVAASDYDTRFTAPTVSSGVADTLTYTWTCTAGRFVDYYGVAITPATNATSVRWQAINPATALPLDPSSVSITCTVTDNNNANINGEAGNRHDPDQAITRVIEVGRITYSNTLSMVPVNDDFDEQNLNQSGQRVGDNKEHWVAGATNGEHRIVATDVDVLQTGLLIRTAVNMSGTLTFTVPNNPSCYL